MDAGPGFRSASSGLRDSVNASLPGLTRQSIYFGKKSLRNLMDARVKPGHDDDIIIAGGAEPI
jgi:hypothetical protein